MSYHIHYTSTDPEDDDFKTFYEGFVAKFSDKFSSTKQCPFGPNYGAYTSDTWPSKTICSLEGAIEFIDETWEWSKANRGSLDLVKHPNSGCMHDDHGLRKVWEGTAHTIATLEFPCNVPATGCIDSDYSGPPSCGCADTLASDAPEDSCQNCKVMGELPPDVFFA